MTLTPVLVDAATLRTKIHDKAVNAFKELGPIDLKSKVLELDNIRVVDRNYTPKDRYHALLGGGSLEHPVKASLKLKNKNGEVIDEVHNFTLTHIPYLTDRHTVIANGNEYQFTNQLRRKPGVYTQRAENGELRTIFNLGKGKNFDLGFNDKKGTFYLQYGTSNIPLYPVLRGLGIDHHTIAAHLGPEVAKENQDEHGHQVDQAVGKLYEKLEFPAVQEPHASLEHKVSVIKKKYGQTTLNPEVTEHTLGRPFQQVDPTALLTAAKKLLDVHKGHAAVDDTDSLAFKTFHSLDDFLAERIKLTARAWIPKARLALTHKNLREGLTAAPFSSSIRKFVTTSDLTAVPTGINPLELLDHAVKVTSLGEGGISSDRAIPLDARMTHATHFGALDPIRTPESIHAGVDIRATIAAHRDDHGNLYNTVRNVKTKQVEHLKAGELTQHIVAFPNQNLKGDVQAFVKGTIQTVPGSSVTHELLHVSHQYSPATSLIPMIHNIQGNRAIMGSKMGTQALPLRDREAPFVQVKSHLPDPVSFETLYGHMVVPTAPVSGVVKKVQDGYVYIEPHTKTAAPKESDKNLVAVPFETHFPFPSKTFLHHDIQVKPGDVVREGQRLGDSNFTRKGTLALGKNLLVGYMPYHGVNSNDAVVISEGCAQKLTSEHMYREVYPLTSAIELSKNKHKAYYGTKYTPSQYAKLDDSAVIKVGTKIDPKDPLILGLTKTPIQGSDLLLGKISKALTKPYKEVALFWEHGTPGEVIEVYRAHNQISVLVKTLEPMNVGDKLAGRYGNKGVVARIVPDHEMIQDEKGRPLDLILTSAGVVSRINPAQIIETAIGKVVEKTGQPILYDNNEHKDAVAWAKNLLKEHGVKDKETVYDPITKRPIVGPDGKGVLVGRQYIYKLFKSTDTNFSGHGVGPYDINEQPLKTGGEESAKGIGKMEFDALLAHNARNFLQEAATVKSQKNDEFWRALQLGLPLPTPKPSFAFNKFVGMLEGAGIRVDKRDSKFKLLPMTDRDILAKSTGAIENKKTLIAKNLKPERGGLFDPVQTGGPNGTLYAHIDLPEPIPHPVFVDPIRKLLNLSQSQFDDKLRQYGGDWFKKQLAGIDVDKKLTELRQALTKAKAGDTDNLVKQIKYLQALKAENLKPHDAYVISKIPVIPPVFRPILPDKANPSQMMVADANKLYAHLLDTTDVLKNTVLEDDRGKHRNLMFHAVGAVFGTHDPIDEKLQKQEVKGFLSNIAGTGSPKGGFFQRKLMRRTQDVSGRGTAVPDVNLNMDQVGIPEQMLWQMYDRMVVSRLIKQGYGALHARELVDKKAPVAKDALQAEIKARPVLINRAPTLQRWSIVAAYPVPVGGKTIRVNPFIEKGMNLDYDGDCVNSMILFTISENCFRELITHNNMLDSWTEVSMPAHFRELVGYVHGDRLFLTNLAEFPHAEELFSRAHRTFYRVPAGIKVIVYDETLGRLQFATPTLWSRHQQREVEIVQLASGAQMVTDDDPRAVYGLNSCLEYTRANPKMAIGMFVPRGCSFDFTEHTQSQYIPKVGRTKIAKSTAHEIPLTMTAGRVFGTMVGDGWVITTHGVPTGIALASTDITVAKTLEADLRAWFVEPPVLSVVERTGGDFGDLVPSCKYVLSSKNLAYFMQDAIGLKAKNKHLPPYFLTAPRDFRLGLFAGLIDTDGSIATNNSKTKPQTQINFTSVSLRLCQEVVWLAKSLGFGGTITPTKTPKGGPCWQVTFSTPELHALKELPCAHPEKQKRFTAFFSSPAPRSDRGGYTRKDPVPLPVDLAATFSKLYKNGTTLAQTLWRAKKDGYVSRFTAQKILADHPELRTQTVPVLQRWISIVDNPAVRWDRVMSYQKTGICEDGYDLTVPGYETFMNVEGVILSNTLQVHVPIQTGAIEDAKQMTLSQMLLADQQRNKLMAYPQHEAIIGATLASKATIPTGYKGPVKHYKTKEEALQDYRSGKLKLTDVIEVENFK